MKAYIYSRGDMSVGISGNSAVVDFDGFEFFDKDHLNDVRAKLKEAFHDIFDNGKVIVYFEGELTD